MGKTNIHRINEIENTLGEKWDRLEFSFQLISGYIDDLKDKGYKSVVVTHLYKGVAFDTNSYNIDQVRLDGHVIISDEIRNKYSMQKGEKTITRIDGI